MNNKVIRKTRISCCFLRSMASSAQRKVKPYSALSKLLLGAVLGANTAIAMAQSLEFEGAYEQGMAAVEERRYALALQHFQRAAQQGHREAQNIAGLMLLYGPRLFGNEIQSDLTQSRYWLLQAAKQGVEVSMAMLKRIDESSWLRTSSLENQP